MGGDRRDASASRTRRSCFNPRPPRGGRRSTCVSLPAAIGVSIHAPAWGATRTSALARRSRQLQFQSTPPAWGATPIDHADASAAMSVSIHAPRVGGDAIGASTSQLQMPCVSIHAPRVGGDQAQRLRDLAHHRVSIHAPRVGGDDWPQRTCNERSCVFQSTPPAWGATMQTSSKSRHPRCFNPRPPRGGRRLRSSCARRSPTDAFQSTPPAWGATSMRRRPQRQCSVSIHAPRVGGDATRRRHGRLIQSFQSTPPAWGATAARCNSRINAIWFQSTPPAWGATTRH